MVHLSLFSLEKKNKQTNKNSNQFEYFSFLQGLLSMSYTYVLNDCFFSSVILETEASSIREKVAIMVSH